MERIFFNTETKDPGSGLPLYVFDTSYLPSPDLINYDAFILTLMNCLPQTKYALVMFNCGLNKISWIWGIKFLKEFLGNDSHNLDLLCKVYTVHDSWFVKSLTQIFTTKKHLESLQKMMDSLDLIGHSGTSGIKGLEKGRKLIRCDTISELGRNLDITRLKISLNIYKHDLLLEDEIKAVGAPNVINGTKVLDSVNNPLYYHHFYQIFKILDTHADKVELIFYKLGNKRSTEILFNCIRRNQVVWINDWDLWCIGDCFKKFLSSLTSPLIPISSITIPMTDSLDFTLHTFKCILEKHKGTGYDKVLYQLMELCHKILATKSTKHTSFTMSKALSHCLSHEVVSVNKDKISIIQRFIKNILDHWLSLRSKFKFPTIQNELSSKSNSVQQIYNSYDVSYNLTLDDDEEELEYRVAFNTTNILSDDSNLTNNLKLPPPIATPRKARPVPASHSQSNINISPSKSPKKIQIPVSPKRVSISPNKCASKSPRRSPHRSLGKNGICPNSPSKRIPSKSHKRNESLLDELQASIGVEKKNNSLETSFKDKSKDNSLTKAKKEVSTSETNEPINKSKKLTDVSNVIFSQEKKKFRPPVPIPIQESVATVEPTVKQPVIRGRKVRELAKLFEERAQGLEILNTM